MKRLFPSPLLSLALFVLWILLRQSLSADTIIWGVVLAVGSVAVTRTLRPGRVRLKAPLTAARLMLTVFRDMLRSNVAVMRVILGASAPALRSGFVRVPLELRDPNGLAVLAVILTFIPGTVWAELSFDRKVLLIHVLAFQRADEVVATIKQHYERPLREIFE